MTHHEVAIGTPMLKTVDEIVECFKDYCVMVAYADEDGIWTQKARITGNVIQGRAELVIVHPNTPDIPTWRVKEKE